MTVHKLSIISPILPLIVYYRYMSTLHHESILEDCYLEILEEFRTDLFNFTQYQIYEIVYKRFEDRCQ